MRISLNSFQLCLCILLFMACEKTEKIDNFPAHKSQLVANCFFVPDTCFIFNLSKSLSPLDNAPFRNMNSPSAYIRVFENNVLFDSFRFNTISGNYSGNPAKIPTTGKQYSFDCYYPGFPRLGSEDYLPEKASVIKNSVYTTITQTYENNDSLVYCSYKANINIDLDPLVVCKYLVIGLDRINDSSGTINRYNYLYINNMKDLNSENDYVFANNSIYIKNEGGIKHVSLQFESPFGYLYKFKKTVFLLVEMRSCTFNSFEYQKRMALQYDNADDPFSEPTPVTNNIINGYGVFGGFNTGNFMISY